MKSPVYCDINYAVRIHDQILNVSGGRPGVLDLGRLDSILEHVQNDWIKSMKIFVSVITIFIQVGPVRSAVPPPSFG